MIRYGHHAHHPVFGIIFLVLIAAVVALGIIYLLRWRRHPHGGFASSPAGMPPGSPAGTPWTGGDSAINELRIRYARGDITREEYWQRSSVLGYPPSPAPGPAGPPSEGQPGPPSPAP
jgi:uncharacterized membrane protein